MRELWAARGGCAGAAVSEELDFLPERVFGGPQPSSLPEAVGSVLGPPHCPFPPPPLWEQGSPQSGSPGKSCPSPDLPGVQGVPANPCAPPAGTGGWGSAGRAEGLRGRGPGAGTLALRRQGFALLLLPPAPPASRPARRVCDSQVSPRLSARPVLSPERGAKPVTSFVKNLSALSDWYSVYTSAIAFTVSASRGLVGCAPP